MPRSFSQLQTYLTCPRQFEYLYVKKVARGPISAGESFGTSMHNALKKWGEKEMKNEKGNSRRQGYGRQEMKKDKLKDDEQLEMFEEKIVNVDESLTPQLLLDLWRSSFVVEGYGTRVEADMAILKGEKILKMYFEWWKENKNDVIAVEKGFKLEVDGTELSGRFDRVEYFGEGAKVIDFKTSAVRTQEFVDADLQLSVYAAACEEVFHIPCEVLSFLFLTEDGIIEMKTSRNESQLRDMSKQIHSINDRVESGDFRPTPSKDFCRRCPYKNVCDVAAA